MELPTTPRLAPGPAPRRAAAGARALLPLLLGLGGALLASGCAGEEKYTAESALDYADNAKRDYQAALAAFEDKNWELADELLNEVKRKYARAGATTINAGMAEADRRRQGTGCASVCAAGPHAHAGATARHGWAWREAPARALPAAFRAR